MPRQELAEAVNAWLAGEGGRARREAALDADHVGKLQRGEHRWPTDLRREGTVEAAAFDAPAGIARRAQRIDATDVGPATAVGLGRLAEAAVAAYDHTPTLAIARRLARPRRRVDELLTGHQHPHQKQRLHLAAARMSGVLAAAAMDLGDRVLARAYSVEAFSACHARRRAQPRCLGPGNSKPHRVLRGQLP
jgi:hypothetical protein